MPVEQEYYVPLYRLAVSKVDENYRLEKISEWLAKNALRVSNQLVTRTLKKAGREDLIQVFLKEEDVKMGDTVKSRSTGRFGKVVGIHWDGETLDVKWESGGVQPLSKGAVFKMKEKEERFEPKDIAIAKSDTEAYKNMKDKDETFIQPKKELEKKKKSSNEYEEWVKQKLANKSN